MCGMGVYSYLLNLNKYSMEELLSVGPEEISGSKEHVTLRHALHQ